MQYTQAMWKEVDLPNLSSITVSHEEAEKPFIPLTLGSESSKSLLKQSSSRFQLASWVRVKASSPHWMELPQITRDREIDTTKMALSRQ